MKGGTITGHVTALDGGAPLEDVYVDVYTSQGGWVDDTETDASGAYSITALPAGSYKVQFHPSLAGPSIAYIEEYYNDKATLSLGDLVNVGAGAVVSGINAVLARGGQFTGQVTAADGGALLQGVEVVVYDNLGYRKGSATTSASGVYTTTGFRPGSYRLEFAPTYGNSLDYLSEFYNDKASMTSADAITLSGPGLTTANAVLARGGSISGTVTSSITGAPLEDVDVSILDVDGYEFEWTYTDVNGQYLARGLPTGVYHVHFSISYCSLKYQIYYNQKTSLAARTTSA